MAGDLQAGADWVSTCSDESGEISMHDLIEMLEDGAIIMSSPDFKSGKTETEQSCYKLGAMCSYEVRKSIQDFNRRTDKLRNK